MDNVLEVSVGVLPGEVKRVAITDDVETIRDVFKLAGFEVKENWIVTIKGEKISLDDSTDILANNDRVYASDMIKGN